MIGALAMWVFSFDWHDKIITLGVMGVVSVSCTLLLWQVVKRRIRTMVE
jgi:DHA1 family bicyclomycin/chloramphenicol resistance-like MFS transporter